jgi:hypothetical protein
MSPSLVFGTAVCDGERAMTVTTATATEATATAGQNHARR